MKKRILSLFFAIIMTLSSVTFVSAASPSTKLTPKTASETVALSFMKNSLSEAVKISETTPYYDLDGNVTAYCISFSLEGKPSGYVLISLLDLDNPIVEFSFDGNGITNTIRKMQNSVYRTAGDRIIFLVTAMRLQMGTVSSLGTLDVRIRDAYTNFLGFRGTNFNTRVLTQNSYSSFTDAIDDQCPVHTMLRNQSIFSTGHDVMTFGYGQSTSGTDYLFVMDGWYSYGRFVNFDFYPIVKGVKVWVGSTPN